MSDIDAKTIWMRAIEAVKDKTTRPALWRALELSHGIVLEDDIFVIGFAPQDSPQAGHLRSSEITIVIEGVLRNIIGRQVSVKLIDGTTPEEYENYKRQQAVAEATRESLLKRKYEERRSDRMWEEIGELLSRKSAASKLRSLPQVRARFLQEAFQLVSDSMDEMYNEPDEFTERAFARVIDKLGVLIDAPSSLVAYELFKFRESRK